MIGPEINVPDVTEPVVGYRHFALARRTQHNFALCSPDRNEWWTSPEKTARCDQTKTLHSDLVVLEGIRPRPHSAPAKDCGCGIYAYFEPVRGSRPERSYVLYGLSSLVPPGYEAVKVAAAVVLSGRLEVHGKGMRAAHARIVALGLYPRLTDDERLALVEIGRRWGVAVVPDEQLATEARKHGSPLDESLRPDVGEANRGPAAQATPYPTFTWSPPWKWWKSPGVLANGSAALANAAVFAITLNPVSAACVGASTAIGAWFARKEKAA